MVQPRRSRRELSLDDRQYYERQLKLAADKHQRVLRALLSLQELRTASTRTERSYGIALNKYLEAEANLSTDDLKVHK
jgi:hypothetical protein